MDKTICFICSVHIITTRHMPMTSVVTEKERASDGLNGQNRSVNGCRRYAHYCVRSNSADTRYGNRRNMVRRVSDDERRSKGVS